MTFISNCMNFYIQTLLIIILFTYLSIYVPTLNLSVLGLGPIPYLIKIQVTVHQVYNALSNEVSRTKTPCLVQICVCVCVCVWGRGVWRESNKLDRSLNDLHQDVSTVSRDLDPPSLNLQSLLLSKSPFFQIPIFFSPCCYV